MTRTGQNSKRMQNNSPKLAFGRGTVLHTPHLSFALSFDALTCVSLALYNSRQYILSTVRFFVLFSVKPG